MTGAALLLFVEVEFRLLDDFVDVLEVVAADSELCLESLPLPPRLFPVAELAKLVNRPARSFVVAFFLFLIRLSMFHVVPRSKVLPSAPTWVSASS